jgi:hypothetical protein
VFFHHPTKHFLLPVTFTMSSFASLFILVLCLIQATSFPLKPVPNALGCDSAFRNDIVLSSKLRFSATALACSITRTIEVGDRFDRWRFLSNVLEGDGDSDTVNQVLFQVLDGALKYPRPTKNEESTETGSPEMTSELKEKLETLLKKGTDGRVNILGEASHGDGSVVELLEGLLPDPREDEDAHKSIWDTVIEIHGREMVQYNETNPSPEWRISSLVARLLIHFDFIIYGNPTGPLV